MEIDGGGIFGSPNNAMGIAITASSDSLLKITFSRTYGDRHSETTISLGNGINLGLGLGSANQ